LVNDYSKRYFPNLDATRFVAFIAVFLEHMLVTNNPTIKGSRLYSLYTSHFHLAAIGVGFFIVLSGFLITWIILEEYQHTSVFDISYFWARRCLRIWPLYFLLIIAGYILVWGTRNFTMNSVHDLPSVLWMLTFTLNFYIVNHGQAFLFFIVFLWSISVEEQLYLVWAVLLRWFKKLLVPFCFLLILASIACNWCTYSLYGN